MTIDHLPRNHYLIFPGIHFINNLPLAGYFFYGKNAPLQRVISHRLAHSQELVLNSKQVRSVMVVVVSDATALPAKHQSFT